MQYEGRFRRKVTNNLICATYGLTLTPLERLQKCFLKLSSNWKTSNPPPEKYKNYRRPKIFGKEKIMIKFREGLAQVAERSSFSLVGFS